MSADLLEAFGREERDSWQQARISSPTAHAAQAAGNLATHNGGSLRDTIAWEAVENLSRPKDEPLWQKDGFGNDVLFDAAGENVEDDFGDFEDVEGKNDHRSTLFATKEGQDKPVPRADQRHESTLIDFLSSDETLTNKIHFDDETAYPKIEGLQMGGSGTVRSFDASLLTDNDPWGDFEEGLDDRIRQQESHVSPTIKKPTTGARIEIEQPQEDDWEPFVDGEAVSGSALVQTVKGISTDPPTKANQRYSKTQRAEPSMSTSTVPLQRPTNVPPPAILLALLPSIFQQLANSAAANNTSNLQDAQEILAVFRVSSRIIAGRSLRWKRDTILAQSTRIGQAGTGGGMKLASVNRGEGQKEQREASEAVDVWSPMIPRFNKVLLRVQMQHPPLKMSVLMPVKVLPVPIASSTPNPCPVCGIKRNERVSSVDSDIEDLFGEYWTEHWGHKDCADFWYTYRSKLSQR